jgi:hypothetical protein
MLCHSRFAVLAPAIVLIRQEGNPIRFRVVCYSKLLIRLICVSQSQKRKPIIFLRNITTKFLVQNGRTSILRCSPEGKPGVCLHSALSVILSPSDEHRTNHSVVCRRRFRAMTEVQKPNVTPKSQLQIPCCSEGQAEGRCGQSPFHSRTSRIKPLCLTRLSWFWALNDPSILKLTRANLCSIHLSRLPHAQATPSTSAATLAAPS